MFIVEATTVINAPVSAVWKTLTHLDDYQAWSTMLHYEGGKLVEGETLELRLTLPGGTNYRFSPEVKVLEPNKRFVWKAVTRIEGIFDGEHSFELIPFGDQQTRLINREVYTGILSPIVKRLPMMKGAAAGFAAMNAEIKAHAEKNVLKGTP